MAGSASYEIRVRVQGELPQSWSQTFADLSVAAQPDGTTLVTGTLTDQSALHGLLATLRDLGLSIVSLETGTNPEPPSPGD